MSLCAEKKTYEGTMKKGTLHHTSYFDGSGLFEKRMSSRTFLSKEGAQVQGRGYTGGTAVTLQQALEDSTGLTFIRRIVINFPSSWLQSLVGSQLSTPTFFYFSISPVCLFVFVFRVKTFRII